MKFYIETERLILRDLEPADYTGIYELDSNPEVHRYLGNKPITTIEQAQNTVARVRQQYIDCGIGRWAVIEKSTGNFTGWSGLKLNTEIENNQTNFYDLGYRFIQKYWGKGYATESAIAARDYGFEKMNLHEIIGTADKRHKASIHVLEKCGLTYVEDFMWEGDILCVWMKITREEWMKQKAAT